MNEAWTVIGAAAASLVWGGLLACWMAPKVKRAFQPFLQAARANPLRTVFGAVFVGAFIAYGATKPYTVAYHANGGEGTMPAQVCTTDVGEELSSNAFTRVGYSFGGWATNATGVAAYADGASISLSFSVSNVVVDLYAVWTPDAPPALDTYKVVFDPNGGDGAAITNEIAIDVAQTLPSNTFARVNYTFTGWATSPTGMVAYADGETVSNLTEVAGETVQLYAVWTALTTYQVVFNPNDGIGNAFTNEFKIGVPCTLPVNRFARIGYLFDGWALSPTGVVEYVDGAFVTNLTDNVDTIVSLYAIWKEDALCKCYEVGDAPTSDLGTVAIAEGTNVIFTGTLRAGMTNSITFAISGPCSKRFSIDPKEGERCGLRAVLKPTDNTDTGWQASDWGATNVVFSSTGTYCITLDGTALTHDYAYMVGFGLEGASIVYNLNGGALAAADAERGTNFDFTVDSPIGYLPVPIKGTQEFDAWLTTNGVPLTIGDLVPKEGVELFAYWVGERGPYQVVFHPNGGVGNVVTQKFEIGVAQALASNAFTCAKMDFAGWSTGPTGVVEFTDGQLVYNLAAANETINLYACWTLAIGVPHSQTADGITWHFVLSAGGATICLQDASSNWVTAVEGAVQGPITVPSSLGGKPVFAIGENAFAECKEMTSLTMTYDLGGNYPDEDAVKVGTGAFRDCTALKTVELPLGVSTLSDELFANCTSLKNFEMPYTVMEIGDSCFLSCTSLTAITVTESVKSIGSKAFAECTSLKVVRYLGDCPEAASDIYYHANANLVSGRLLFRDGWAAGEVKEVSIRGTAEADLDMDAEDSDDPSSDDDSTGANRSEPAGDTTIEVVMTPKWPDGDASRPLLKWETKLYQFCNVAFNYNDNGSTKSITRIYVKDRMLGALGDLPDLDASDGSGKLDLGEPLGWFTARYTGREVTKATVVTVPVTYYVHWSRDDDSERGVGAWTANTPLYTESEEEPSLAAAVRYDAYLLQDGQLAGTAQFNVAKGRYSKVDEETVATVTATINLRGKKKYTMRGKVNESGEAVLTRSGYDSELSVTFSENGVSGDSDDGFAVDGARNRFSSNDEEDKRTVAAALGRWNKTWTVVLHSDSGAADGEGAEFAGGYSALSVAVGGRGRVRVFGTMADGTRVSSSTLLLIGDGVCAVPVSVPLYMNKEGGFGFLVWLPVGDPEDEGVAALSEWDAKSNKDSPFAVPLEATGFGAVGAHPLKSGSVFTLGGDFMAEGVDVWQEFLPSMPVTVSGGKWTVPAKGSVSFVRDEESYVDRKESENPSGLKLSYAAKTGLFSGSFKVYGVTDGGKAKSYTAKVVGGVVGGAGYGTAIIKKVGSAPVLIGGE